MWDSILYGPYSLVNLAKRQSMAFSVSGIFVCDRERTLKLIYGVNEVQTEGLLNPIIREEPI